MNKSYRHTSFGNRVWLGVAHSKNHLSLHQSTEQTDWHAPEDLHDIDTPNQSLPQFLVKQLGLDK